MRGLEAKGTDARQAFIPIQSIHFLDEGRWAPWVPAAVGKRNVLTADMLKPGAVVIDVGMNRDEAGKLVPLDVKAGDRVLFGKWSGTEVKLDGEDLLIMKESDIMGVIA